MLTLDQLAVTPPEPQAATRRRGAAAEKKKTTGVAVLPLQGLITPKASILSMLFGGGGGLGVFREQLREALADEEVDAIVLDVDSPGGSSALVEETAAEIRAARAEKPILAVANTDAGSAAYWLASQATELYVTPSGMVGSVGAYILHVDYSGMNEQMGINPTYISAGRYKVEGNPEEPLSEEATAYLQAHVDECYAAFVADVAAGRGIPEKTVRNSYGEGRMLTASPALDAGMVDGIATLEGVVGSVLAGEDAAARGVSSERLATLTIDEAPDEDPSGSSLRVSRWKQEDQRLADEVAVSAIR